MSEQPYYDRAGITLYRGDCRDVLPALGGVDHVLTDPPYSEHTHAKSRAGHTLPDIGTCRARFNRAREFGFEAITPELMTCCAGEFGRLAKRWVLVFSDIESTHLWRAALEAARLEYIRTGVWRKIGCTPQFTGDRPATAVETITICHPKGRKKWNGGGSHAFWEHPIVLNRSHSDPRLHTAQKPLPLMLDLVEAFTDPGDLILDPFAGSGTTLLAALRLGRRAIGVEADEHYCEVTAKRLAAADGSLEMAQRHGLAQSSLLEFV